MKLIKMMCLVVGVGAVGPLGGVGALGCKKDESASKDKDKAASGAKTTTGDMDKAPPVPKPEPKTMSSNEVMAAMAKCGEALNARDKTRLGDCYDKGSSFAMLDWMGPKMHHTGLAAITESLSTYWTAFPNVTGKPQLILASGNKIATIMLESGKNSGSLMGMPATNKTVTTIGAGLTMLNPKGKIRTAYMLTDQTTWAHQMGRVENPTSPSTEMAWEKTIVAVADDANKDLVATNVGLAEAFEGATARKDMAALKAHVADDVTFRYAPMKEVTKGAEAYLAGMTRWAGMFESMTRDVKDIWGAGDWVVAHVENTARLGVDLPNPTNAKTKGKEVKTNQIVFYQFKDQKVVSHWVFENSYAFAVQAGLADAPPKMDGMK